MQDFSPLLRFYLNQIPDRYGRYLSDIWEFDHRQLEYTHNYIQWLFPLEVKTKFNKPFLTEKDCLDFSRSELLKQNQKKSLDVMLNFWGLRWNNGNIIEKDVLTKKEYEWLKPYNHNQLRMTRTIHSLALCDQLDLAIALQQGLLNVSAKYGNVSEKAKCHWLDATNIVSIDRL